MDENRLPPHPIGPESPLALPRTPAPHAPVRHNAPAPAHRRWQGTTRGSSAVNPASRARLRRGAGAPRARQRHDDAFNEAATTTTPAPIRGPAPGSHLEQRASIERRVVLPGRPGAWRHGGAGPLFARERFTCGARAVGHTPAVRHRLVRRQSAAPTAAAARRSQRWPLATKKPGTLPGPSVAH